MHRHRKELQPLTQINLTSMLDVAFVLLIAFMIVAPSIKYGIDLDLPTISEGAPQLTQKQHSLYTITVPKAAGSTQEFFMNNTPSKLEDIENRLRMQKKTGADVAVEIQADGAVSYETFIQLVAALRRAGIESVGLPVEAGTVSVPTKPIDKPANGT